MIPLQADEIFACLDRRHVRYVLIGGLAAVLHGSPLATYDVDICPARDPDNLRRLAEALEELEARIRTPGDAGGVAFPREAEFLSNVQILNLVTRFGDFDISFQPSGTKGFEDLSRSSVDSSHGHRDQRCYPSGHHPIEGSSQPTQGFAITAPLAAAPRRDPEEEFLTGRSLNWSQPHLTPRPSIESRCEP